MARVLLIDDDQGLLDALTIALEGAGHDVVTATDGDAGLRAVIDRAPALVVSDVNMGGLDGFALLGRVRARQPALPFILLTSRDSDIDEALGLDLGADDYVTKPFSTRVLLARVAALLRRAELALAPEAQSTVITVDALTIDTERLVVAWQGAPIVTTVSELRLVEALARRPGVVFTRTQLLEKIRGDDSVVADRLIDTYVRRLRRKLEEKDPSFDRIETLVGAGYRWRANGA